MKSSLRPALVLLTSTVLFSAGCATRTTPSGGKETSLLGGAQLLSQWLKWSWAPVVDVTWSDSIFELPPERPDGPPGTG
jgi:hypothetical protein